jgi:hypothetical protein
MSELPEIVANFVLEQEAAGKDGYCLTYEAGEAFKRGWVRCLSLRYVDTHRKGDVCYLTPAPPERGQLKLRSWAAIKSYIATNPESGEGLGRANFDFGCRSLAVGPWPGEIIHKARPPAPRKVAAAGEAKRPRGRPRKLVGSPTVPCRQMSSREKASRATDRQLRREQEKTAARG